ncbi:MAG TPA: helix-turn-helix transcriptional regulator [Bacilli bacterium]|nr:helix-turn-helix transcriptional regulator [Bacilli bacterium]
MIRGERLRSLRLSKNMTQDELASLMGLKKSTICTYEKEKRRPKYDVIQKYMEIFGVTAEYLMGIDHLSVREDKEQFNYFSMSNNEIELIKLLRENKMIYDILLNDPKRGMEIIKIKIG